MRDRSPAGRLPRARAHFDFGTAQRAMREFLEACGFEAQGELAETPERVARLWAEKLLDGYGRSVAEILSATYPVEANDLVFATNIGFHAICPHHLLPYCGAVHLAYEPAGRIVGLSRLVDLVDCAAHRLVLQEHLAADLADALVAGLGAAGAAALVEASQLCVVLEAAGRPGVRTAAEAFRGSFGADPALRARFREACQAAAAGGAAPGATAGAAPGERG